MSEEEVEAGKEREVLIMKSKTKAYIKEHGCMVAGDSMGELNNKIYDLLDAAIKRTKDNKRSTVRPQDF